MSNLKNGFRMAMEELEEGEAAAAVAETETAEVPAEVHSEVDAAVADGDAIVEAHDDIDGAVEDTNSLDAIGDKVEATLDGEKEGDGEGEGLTPEDAEIVEVAVESLYRHLHVRKPLRLSAEAFGKDRTRKQATKMAVEDIRESVQKAWKVIKEFFQRMWAAVQAFFKKVFGTTDRLKRAAEAIVTRAKAAGNEAAAKEIAAGGFASKIEVAGQVNPANTGKYMKDLANVYDTLMDATTVVAMDAMVVMQGVSEGDTDGKSVDMGKYRAYASKKRGQADVQFFGSVLPGNKVFAITLPEKGGTLDKMTFGLFTRAKFGLTEFDPKHEFKADKVAVATPEQAIQIAEGVITIADSIDSQKDTESSIGKMIAEAVKFADEALKKADEAGKGDSAELRRGVSKFGSLLGTVPSQLTGYTLGTAKAALDYAGKSLSQYGKQAKTEEAAK